MNGMRTTGSPECPARGPRIGARALAWLLVALSIASCARHPEAVKEISEAGFLAAVGDAPPSDAAPWRTQPLPDAWEASRPGASGFGWYRFRVQAPPAPGDLAVYLTATLSNSQLYLNGNLAGQSGELTGEPPERWEAAQLLVLPAAFLRPGDNVVHLRIHVPAGRPGGIGRVLVGPPESLYGRGLLDHFGHMIGPAAASLTLLALGAFILVLWLRIREEREYLLFAVATILWGLHTAVTLLPRAPLPAPHFAVWWNAVYVLWVVLLCVFCVRFAGERWPRYERGALSYAAASVPALYAAAAANVLMPAAALARLGAIALAAAALFAVVRNALRARDGFSGMLLATAAVAATIGVRDWLAAQDPANLRPMYLVPYVAIFFFALVGWVMIDRFAGTLRKYQELNVELEARVAEKSRALEREAARQAQARREAESANLAKSRFLAAASHDLRQPLHALGLFASALDHRAQDPESREIAGRINQSIAALETLFNEVLDVSRLDAGAVKAEPRAVPLQPLFDRVANDFSSPAGERDLALRFVPTARTARTDPVLLERILRNLVSNAIRYTRAGGILVGVRRRAGRLALEVRDSGIGIPEEHLARVFDEFYQVGRSDRDRRLGLGLGLSIVKRMCDLLGHPLEVASRPGHGTTFRVILEETDPPLPGEAEAGIAVPGPALAGARIVVIDDDGDVRDSMGAILRAWGCEVFAVATEAQALAAAGGDRPPSLLIVDYRLGPGGTGIDAARSLRRQWGEGVPVLVISGESSEGELERIRGSGFPVLHKPVPPARLRSILAHLLGGAAA